MKSLRQNTLLFLISILFHISLTKDISDPIQIDINSEIEQIYEITPDISYKFNLNNKSLAYFIESSVEDLIYYDSDQPCPKFCAIKDNNINNIYINHNQILKEKSSFKLTALPNVNAAISSTKIESPKISGIFYMPGTNIQLIQVTEKNYLFTNSYDNYLKIYFGEYYEGITISDIININTEIYKERHGEIIELNPDKIYIVFFVTNYSFSKVYLYNALPKEINIANGDNNILYLLQGNNYILNFGKNTMGFTIRLNPIKNSTLDISSDSSQKTLSLDDKYFTPDKINGNIYINNIENNNALIEILFSFNENNTEIISETKIENKILEKKVSLIEYIPQEKEKNLEIYLSSEEDFSISLAYGGPSKDNYFYYSSHIEDLTSAKIKKYFIKLENPLKNIKYLEETEKYYLSLIFEKTKENQEIKLSLYYNSNPIYDLYEDLSEDYTNSVISNLTSIITSYAYIEIAQNPPQPEGIPNYNHDPIDLIDSLEKMNRTNVKFYDFYRNMREILGTVRDLHFRIFGLNTPKGIKLDQITACLPFSFYVANDVNNNTKMFVKYFESCGAFFTEEERNYIKERSEKTPLKYINGQNPFDYVQEWGRKYRGNKSPHAHFTLMKTLIHSFYIRLYPYTPEELKMTFEFESSSELIQDKINLDYYIFIPNVQTVQKLYSKININFDQNDFDEYFKSQLEKNYKSGSAYEPNIFEVIEKYNILKGYINKKNSVENKIDWTYTTPEENGIKCRVDDINQINIFVQGSFSLDDAIAQEVMYNCTRDFYKNDYKIIGIQNRDGGGWAHLCLIFHQLVQVKTQDRAFKASRISEFFKRHVLDEYDEIINVETCKPFNTIDDLMTEIIDDFSREDKELLHHRSQVFNYIDKDVRKKLRDIRQEFYSYGHLKRPTDIIIYTDSFSYSATSSFIKGFQYQGGAIIVGFNGNPFIPKEQFDGSQSPASVTAFDFSEEYKNLQKLGIVVSGITWAETYDDYYEQENPLPREYLLDPVDERVDIYEPYTDDNYQLFIDKAKEIFDKYNSKGECNKDNKKLTLEPLSDECYVFDDDEFAHGGYECNDEGKWSNVCRKYYCDIGYYYNHYKGKCIRDICGNDDGEEDIYLNGEYENVITLNSQNNKEYIFYLNNSDYTYFFESENLEGYIHYGYNISCTSKLCALKYGGFSHKNKVHLNYYRNATGNNINIKITSVKNYKGIINSIKTKDYLINDISPILKSKNILLFEGLVDYILYIKSLDNTISISIAEYNNEMSIDDILNINPKYFDNCNGELIELNTGKIYIISTSTEVEETYNKPYDILLQPKILNEEPIEINENKKFIYFAKEKEYNLDFSNNNMKSYLALSRLTLDSEIKIKETETGEEVTINKNNIYYRFNEIDGIFKGKIVLKINNQKDALLSFIYKCDDNDTEILNDKEYLGYKLSKGINIIKFDNNKKDKFIRITIKTNNQKEIKFEMFRGFGLNNYIEFSKNNNFNFLPKKYSKTNIIIYNPNYLLEQGESFYLALIFESDDIKDISDPILISKSENLMIDDLNVDFSEEKCNLVLDNIKKLMEEGYVYNEIIKNPPNPQYFGKVNLISELNNIKTKKRKYYDFFRDFRQILGKMKDAHLNLIANKSPNGYELKKISICLPFFFIVKGNSPSNAEIGIKIYEDCFKYYDNKTQEFIKAHHDINIDRINNGDPFDFIQNLQSVYNSIHNKHGQFSYNLNSAHKISLVRNPFKRYELENIEFVFKDGEKINLDYYLYYSNEDKELIDDNEFLEFYDNEIRKEINTLNEISILDIKNKYNKLKNVIYEKEKNEIEWEYYTTNKEGLKCRVDSENQVNIFVQTTFNFIDDEYYQALEVIDNCTEAFYKNSYPIIGIESNNGGGIVEVSLYLQQFLQVKILQRTHFSTKVSNLMKEEMEKNMNDIINIETCEKFDTFDEMKEIVDDYGKDEQGFDIEHHRTKIFHLFNKTTLKEHKNRRKKYFDNYKLKKPTEIIIFTDSFSYSSTSFFIKGLQETGGAILVGYKGNPKSDEFFEASHSPSAVSNFNGTDIYDTLYENGFEIIGTTFFESYNYSYQEKNPIPREYLTHPIDERVNIYQSYDDTLYQQFIDEAKIIFEKYNLKKGCNPDNQKLLFEPDDKKECYEFKEDSHAHGGYLCDNKTKQWSDICAPFYCDIGYYFDHYKNKCVLDQCTEPKEEKDNEEEDSFPVWAIVVITISVILVIVIIIVLVKIFYKRNKEETEEISGDLLVKSKSDVD